MIHAGKVESYTVESGQYLARRYFSLYDAYNWASGNTSVDEEIYKNVNTTSGSSNIEHFIVNRNFEYALYCDDGNTIDVKVAIPRKFRKYVATIANYLLLNSEINSKLRNRPVYQKIEMIEAEIEQHGIDYVIPNKRSQLHYYLVKEVFHEFSNFPAKELGEAKTKTLRKQCLKAYYSNYFEEEFLHLTQLLGSGEKMFALEIEHHLLAELGFFKEDGALMLSDDPTCARVEAEIDEKKRKIKLSFELFNPYFAETGEVDERYITMVESVADKFKQVLGKEPCLSSSEDYFETCPDVSYTFSYVFSPELSNIKKFLSAIDEVEALDTFF